MLHARIQDEVKRALKEKNTGKLNALRGLLSAVTNELVAQGKKPSDTLSDEEIATVAKRQVKQRRDSIEQFRGGGRDDLAENEEKELSYLEAFLPKELPREEIEKIVSRKKEELGVHDKKDAGKLIGAVMREVKGKTDGRVVKEAVDKVFSQKK